MNENEMVQWEGPGWYACRQEWGRIRWWFVSNNDDQPETRLMALGTPEWFDENPY